MKCSVILLCSGKSTRMNGIDKQLSLIGKIPVIVRSALTFDDKRITELIVVANENNITQIQKEFSKYNINKPLKFVTGAETRQKSAYNGLLQASQDNDYIAVHDGARPLIDKSTISAALDNAQKYGGSIVAVPVKDTIKEVNNELVSHTIDRSKLFSVQTPQIFKKSLYKQAIENAIKNNKDFSDDSQLFETDGYDIFITRGKYSNIKITTPEDIEIAEIFLQKGL